jgi:HK97 family phage major capsid protein
MSNLREQRARANESRLIALRENNQAAYEKADADVNRLTEEIRKAEGSSTVEVRGMDGNQKRAFNFAKYLRGKELTAVEMRDVAEGAPMLNHVGTYTGLGFLVPTGFKNAIEDATKYYAPLMDGSVFTVLETATGNPLPFPTSNDTSNSAVIVGEAGSISEQDITASHIVFAAYKLSAGIVKASVELLQDSAFNLEAWLADRFGVRYGRGLESYLTNGNGSSQPTGLLQAVSNSGVTPVIAAGSSANDGTSATGANSIGSNDLVNLEHSVDPTYRRGAKYMFHDQTLAQLKKLLDKYGRPLWAPGITSGDPDRINGYEYVINQSMPQIAASNVTVAFGDLKKFQVRKVSGISVQRLNELYAANGQVGFVSNMRVDSNLLDAGTHPVNVLQQHS